MTPTMTSSTTTPLSATNATGATPEPTLGQLAGIFFQGTGFGEVRPSEFFNGGDPTGLVQHIVWKWLYEYVADEFGEDDPPRPIFTVARSHRSRQF